MTTATGNKAGPDQPSVRNSVLLRVLPLYIPLKWKLFLLIFPLFLLPVALLVLHFANTHLDSLKNQTYANHYLRGKLLADQLTDAFRQEVEVVTGKKLTRKYTGMAGSYKEIPVSPSCFSDLADTVLAVNWQGNYYCFYRDNSPNGSLLAVRITGTRSGFLYTVYDGAFIGDLLVASVHVEADNRIFLYTKSGLPLVSNSIEDNFRVPDSWVAEIQKSFSVNSFDSIRRLPNLENDILLSRVELPDTSLVMYVTQPYNEVIWPVKKILINDLGFVLIISVAILLISAGISGNLSKFMTHIRNLYLPHKDQKNISPFNLIGDERNEIFAELRKHRAEELQAIREKELVSKDNQIKTNLLSTLSHEIRTPLNAVIGLAEVLSGEPDVTEKSKETIGLIRDSGISLLRILNDVLALSKLDAGKEIADPVSFSPAGLANDITDLFRAQAKKKNLILVTSFRQKIPATVYADAVKLRQILANLLSNAVKFTQSGKVELRLRLLRHNRLSFTVADTGRGIPRSLQSKVFDPFFTQPSTDNNEGTGLGLHICTRVADVLGTRIKLKSMPGKGSVFNFVINYAEGKLIRKKNEGQSGGQVISKPLKLLLAEDNEVNSMILKAFLKDAPVRIDHAQNGKEAVDMFSTEVYDIVLMDMNMPVISGDAAVRQIRILDKNQQKRTPVIAITAGSLEHEQHRANEAGCDIVLTKPIKQDELISAIAALTASKEKNNYGSAL